MHAADLVERFFARVAVQPDAIAVESRTERISYADFARRVRAYAAVFAAAATQPRVLLQLEQSADAYAAMLGTLLAGGYYCPVNVALPVNRISTIIERFDPHVLVRDEGSAGVGESSPAAPSLVAVLAPAALPLSPTLNQQLPAHELVYVIFTSGSTGQPKGVAIRRTALAHFIDWAIGATGAGPGDRWGQFSNLGFDLSAMDTYTALCTGATLVPIAAARDRLLPARVVRDFRLTIWHSVPSAVALMLRAGQVTAEYLSTLRLVSFCGEPLPPQYLDALFAANPRLTIFNTYGPTEGTVFCTALPLTQDNYRYACDTTVALGDPIPGWQVTLLGEAGASEGELLISGEHIGAGYWRDPVATAAAYGTVLRDGEQVPSFRTGDWVERRDGLLFFKARLDRQAKVSGYRIELDEVDFYIRSFGVAACLSLVYDGKIAAFLEAPEDLDVTALIGHLSAHLPHYEVPAKFVRHDHLPRNTNDKIDGKTLLEQLQRGEE